VTNSFLALALSLALGAVILVAGSRWTERMRRRFPIVTVLGGGWTLLALGFAIGPHGAGMLEGDRMPQPQPILLILLAWSGVLAVVMSGVLAVVMSGVLAVVMSGLVAGAEIDRAFLRERARTIARLAAGQIFPIFIAVGAIAFLFLRSIEQSIIVATIAATSSSAVAVALLREMRHPTDFARLILATVVAKDLLLVLVFSTVLFFVAATTNANHLAWYWISLHLTGSIGVGFALAFPLRIALARIERRMTTVVLVTAIFVAILCTTIGVAPLITALTLGFTARTIAPVVTASFFATSRRLFLAVCCVFFAAAGAHLDLASLVANWSIVMTLCAVRLAALWTGATLAARHAGLSHAATRWAWAGFLPQAGISLALAAQIATEFPGQQWASALATIVIACIALNEIVGPVMMRIALLKVPSSS